LKRGGRHGKLSPSVGLLLVAPSSGDRKMSVLARALQALPIGICLFTPAFAQSSGPGPAPNSIDLVQFADWTKVCGKDKDASANVCYTTADFGPSKDKPPTIAVAVYRIEGRRGLVLRLLLPVGLMQDAGFSMSLDNSARTPGKFKICFPNGCFAESALDEGRGDELLRAARMSVAVHNQNDVEVTFRLSLGNFRAAFEGPGIAPEVLAQRDKQQAKEKAEQTAATVKPPAAIKPLAKRVALIIANSQYQAQAPLKNPINDARLLESSLRAAGFQTVTVKSDLTREQLIVAIRDFATTADGADWAVIYYSGHGMAYDGINYLIPVDAQLKVDRDIDLEAIDAGKLLSAIDGARQLRLVVLDMCRANPFVSRMRRTVASRSVGRGLAPIEPNPGEMTVFAAKDGQEALDGDGANSPFAESLAKYIGTPNIEIRRLFDLVRDDVLVKTHNAQQPFTYGSLPGRDDFYFTRN